MLESGARLPRGKKDTQGENGVGGEEGRQNLAKGGMGSFYSVVDLPGVHWEAFHHVGYVILILDYLCFGPGADSGVFFREGAKATGSSIAGGEAHGIVFLLTHLLLLVLGMGELGMGKFGPFSFYFGVSHFHPRLPDDMTISPVYSHHTIFGHGHRHHHIRSSVIVCHILVVFFLLVVGMVVVSCMMDMYVW
ncbi:hypothetical protein B0T22DRAFT_284109 [Podospora appendiculata]|uniref:Uncharacterized protein n=1 Tax=Podospora appendiculata TaxID=314037 RepID=A0AAE0X1F7_9PEZI|nr:hypothetical protein B0T22DRAFT_284109 [Podospora appendiculata]